jgi:peptide/nickel transport system ATP-binding protein
VKDLHTYFFTELGVARALNGVTLDVPLGQTMGIVGESGCGKSVTALSIMRLVPRPGRLVSGEITLHRFTGTGSASEVTEVLRLTDLDPRSSEMRRVRGAEIGMVFQEPMTSLNPSYTVGNQIVEAILFHSDVSKREAYELATEMLGRVGMPNPQEVVQRYPHELSGGMRQRAMIAMSLSCHPSVLIADEPTTALDVTTEAQILELIRELQSELGMTAVFITHNLGVVAQMCDTVAVMYLGRVVEQAPVEPIFYSPKHPYTRALLRSIPRVDALTHVQLEPIRGVVPDPYAELVGCPFHPRCDSFKPGVCDVYVPAETPVHDQHSVRCFLYSDRVEDQHAG